MTASTLSSLRPRLPAGWKRAKSSRVNSRRRVSTKASASPTAIMAVVLVLASKPSGQELPQRPQHYGNIGLASKAVLSLLLVRAHEGRGHLPQGRQQPLLISSLSAYGSARARRHIGDGACRDRRAWRTRWHRGHKRAGAGGIERADDAVPTSADLPVPVMHTRPGNAE